MMKKLNILWFIFMIINVLTGGALTLINKKKQDLILIDEIDRAVVRHFKN